MFRRNAAVLGSGFYLGDTFWLVIAGAGKVQHHGRIAVDTRHRVVVAGVTAVTVAAAAAATATVATAAAAAVAAATTTTATAAATAVTEGGSCSGGGGRTAEVVVVSGLQVLGAAQHQDGVARRPAQRLAQETGGRVGHRRQRRIAGGFRVGRLAAHLHDDRRVRRRRLLVGVGVGFGGGGGGVATAPLLFPSASAPRRQLSPLSPTLIRIRFTAPTKQRFYFDPLKIQVFK